MNKLKTLQETSCSCPTCQLMCHRPCWGTPEDIKKIIDAGLGDRLSNDYWGLGTDSEINIIAPALKGYEGKRAPPFPISKQGCTFFKDGLCELHDLKLKPVEGRLANCKMDIQEEQPTLHEEVAMSWDNEEARALVESWSQNRDLEPGILLKVRDLMEMMDLMAWRK